MEFRRFKDIVAVKNGSNLLGYHARNLQVAEITSDLWESMEAGHDDLESWNRENDNEVTDEVVPLEVREFSINIAQVCNLKCSYCGAGGDGTYGAAAPKIDLSPALEQVKMFLQKLTIEPSGEPTPFRIRYIGGEPLLYPQAMRQISEYAQLLTAGQNVDLQFSVTTNGTLINRQVADMLAHFKFFVVVSLDSLDERNDQIRRLKKGGSSTALTLEGLKQLARVRSELRGLSVNSVFGTHNVDVLSTYVQLRGFNFDRYNFNFAGTPGDEAASEEYLKQMQLLAEKIFAREGLEGLARIVQFHEPISRLARRERKWNYCGAGKNLLQADTRGHLFACNWFMDQKSEMVGQGTVVEADKLAPYQESLVEKHKCTSCWARHLCGGGCMFVNYSKTGNKHDKDLSFCLRSRALAALGIFYFAQSLKEETA